MNPEQDRPNMPASQMPPAPAEQPPDNGMNFNPMVGEPQKSGRGKWIVLVIIILLILLALFFGWWWWKDRDKNNSTGNNQTTNNTSQNEEADTSACIEGMTEYENTALGIGFCYPSDWGTVTVADAKFEDADTGLRWQLSFADKDVVNLGLVSADWSTEVARDGTCVDPATQILPAFSPFSTAWATEGTPVTSATRGIEVQPDSFLIDEAVDDLLTNGVCIHGYTIINDEVYTHTAASYFAEFNTEITTPQQHIDNPNVLVPEAERTNFYDFVKSVRKL